MITATLVAATVVPALVLGQPSSRGNAKKPQPVRVATVRTLDTYKTMTVAAAPTGRRVAVAMPDYSVKVLDAQSRAVLTTLAGHPRDVTAIAWNPAGTMLATGDGAANIWLWDPKTGKSLAKFKKDKGHIRAIQSLAFSPDGKSLASVGDDDMLKVWSAPGGLLQTTLLGKGANFFSVAYSPASTLYVGTLAEGMRIYAPKTFALAASLKLGGGQGANSIAVNRQGTVGMTAGRDGRVTFFNLKNRQMIANPQAHGDFWVMRGAFSPNGRLVATSGNDGTVAVWEVASRRLVRRIENQATIGSPLAWTGDGGYLVTTNAYDQVQLHQITPAQR